MKNWNRIRPKFNLVIDFIMMVVMMAVAGLGFLMKYVLLPGYKVNEIYGTDAELYFLGLDRHQWGAIHLYLALFLLFLLILHIVFHWSMILSIFRRMVKKRIIRIAFLVFMGILSLFLAFAPLLVRPEVAESERKHHRHRATAPMTDQTVETVNESLPVIPVKPIRGDKGMGSAQDHQHRHQTDGIVVDGTMTLEGVAERYGMSVGELARVIGVPPEYSNERLGRLRKSYEFEMDDIRIYIIQKQDPEKE